MPDYKRKKVHKGLRAKRERTVKSNDIIMKSTKHKYKSVVPENDIKIVRGAKLKQKQRVGVLLSVIAITSIICLVLSLVLPVSLYENIVNTFALVGHGSYPLNIYGSTVINAVSNDTHYYVLTDTNISAYTNGGKKIFTEMHGFSNPIICVSDTRALVFDQGGKNAYIYNLSGQIYSVETNDDIITANISRSGTLAIATHSDGYASTVYIYDKSCEQIFTWNSAKDIVNNVLLNSSGSKFAVSTVNAAAGQYVSNVLVQDLESADPLYSLNLDTSVVMALHDTGKGFSIIANDKYKFVSWSKFNTNEIVQTGEINLCRTAKNGTLLVFNRANNRSDNTVVIISNKGVKVSEFKLNGIITDISYSKNRIYYVSDNTVNILDRNGTVLRTELYDYGATKFTVIGSNSLALIADKQIIKTTIEKGE